MHTLINKMSLSTISPDKVLMHIVKGWVGIALIGQWLFAAYIISLYALPTLVLVMRR